MNLLETTWLFGSHTRVLITLETLLALILVVQQLSCVWLCPPPWSVAHQAPLSFGSYSCCSAAKLCLTLPPTMVCSPSGSSVMGFSRQEYWNGLSFLLPEDLLSPRMEPMSLMSPALAGGFFTTSTTWGAGYMLYWSIIVLEFCVGFCCTTKWICYMCTYIPFHVGPHSHHPHLIHLGHHRAPIWAPSATQQPPTSYLFNTQSV